MEVWGTVNTLYFKHSLQITKSIQRKTLNKGIILSIQLQNQSHNAHLFDDTSAYFLYNNDSLI